MKSGWDTVKLGTVCDFQGGSQPAKSNFSVAHKKGYVRLLQIRDFKSDGKAVYVPESPNNKLCSNQDIMIGRYGASVGQIHRGKSGAYNVALIRTIPDESTIDRDFLYYYLTSSLFQQPLLRVAASRSAQAGFSKPDIAAFSIPIPPIPEQRRIVGILDDAFASIATAKADAEKNLQNARALFASHINTIFTERGDGWVSATVGELVEQELIAKPLDGNHGEIHPKKSDFVASGVPFIMASHLSNGIVDQESCYFISKKQASSLRKGFAKDGDVLLSHKGTIGRVAILETPYDFVVLTPQVTFYRILDDTVLYNRYLYFFFQSPIFQNEMARIAGAGSTRAYIGITKQQELQIDYPRLTNQLRIATMLTTLAEETQRLESVYRRKLDALDELKKSLLHQAFLGKL